MNEQLPTEPGYYLGRTGVLYRLGTDHIFRDETGRKRWVSETLTRLFPLSIEDRTAIARGLLLADAYEGRTEDDFGEAEDPIRPVWRALATRIAPERNHT